MRSVQAAARRSLRLQPVRTNIIKLLSNPGAALRVSAAEAGHERGTGNASGLDNSVSTDLSSASTRATLTALGRVDGINDVKGYKTVKAADAGVHLGFGAEGGPFVLNAKGGYDILTKTENGSQVTLSLDKKQTEQFAGELKKVTSERAAASSGHRDSETWKKVDSYAAEFISSIFIQGGMVAGTIEG